MKQRNSFLRLACALIAGLFICSVPLAQTNATKVDNVRDALQSAGVSYGVALQFESLLDDINFTETDTIIDDSIYTGWGGGGDFQMEFDGSDMLMTGIATVGLTLDLDSGSVSTETFDITAYNITLDASGNMSLLGNLDITDGTGASPDLTFTDASSGTLVILKPDASAATITTVTDGLTLSCTTDNAVMTLQGQAGSPDAGDDLVLDFDNFALAAGGAVTWPGQAGSLATKAATALTIYGGDDGADAGEDVIIVSESWGVDANGDLLFDDDATDSPKATWTDASAGTLVIYKPDAAAASIVSTTDGLTVQAAAAKVLTLAADDASANTENVVVTSFAWGVDASGNVLLDDDTTDSPTFTCTDATAGSLVIYKPDGAAASIVSSTDGIIISSTEDNSDVTIQAQAGSPDAGDDLILDFDNIAVDAAGALTWPGQAGSLATKADTALTITGGDNGTAAGEDVIIVSESWGVDVNGNLLFDDDVTDSPTLTFTDATAGDLVVYKPDGAAASITSSTDGIVISSTEDDGTITIQTQAGSPDGGDDLIVECDNFDVDADGTVSINGTDITTATGLEGEAIDADTIDDDSIDFDDSIAAETADAVSLYDFGMLRGSGGTSLADPGADSVVVTTVTVTGAAAGDYAICACTVAPVMDEGTFACQVTATDTVTVSYYSSAAHQDPDAAGTWQAIVFQE